MEVNNGARRKRTCQNAFKLVKVRGIALNDRINILFKHLYF